MKISFKNLRIRDANHHYSLPDWIDFFLNLGAKVSQRMDVVQSRTMIVCSLPTRSFAAPFFAFGVVSARIYQGASDAELEQRFQMMKSLPAETKLIYRTTDKLYKAIKAVDQSNTIIEGEPRVRILIQNEKGGNLAELISKKRAITLEIAANQEFSLPKNTNGMKTPPIPAFLKAFFEGNDVNHALSRSHLDVMFVGNVTKLHEETCLAKFSCQDKNGIYHEGTLNDILQIQNFCSIRQVHRTRIVTNSDLKTELELPPETIAVFDGSLPFLKHFHKSRGQVSLVLLDRTEPQYQEAVSELNRRRLTKRIGFANGNDWVGVVPAGVEVVMWEERL